MVIPTHCSVSNIILACLLAPVLCLGNATAGESEQILTSIKPLALIAREITEGTALQTGYLLAPSVSEHNYALKMSDIKRLRNASLVVWLDKDIEPYLEASSGSWVAADQPAKSLALLVAMAPALHKDNGGGGGHDHVGVDPHVWLSPPLARQLAGQIAERLAQLYPQNKMQFASNLAKFDHKTAILDEIIAKKLEPRRSAPFFVQHDAYGYFVEHYGLNQVGVMRAQPEAALSLGQLRGLQLTMQKQAQALCLFHEPQLGWAQAPVFDKGSVMPGVLDPLGIDAKSYSELMENLANGFLGCFERGKGKS